MLAISFWEAEGIEDMQIALGIDTTNTSSTAITEVGAGANDDAWLYNYAGDTTPALVGDRLYVFARQDSD